MKPNMKNTKITIVLIPVLVLFLLSCNKALGQKNTFKCPQGKENIVINRMPIEKMGKALAIYLWDSLTNDIANNKATVSLKANEFNKVIDITNGCCFFSVEKLPQKVEITIECPEYNTIKREIKIPVPSEIMVRLSPKQK